MNYHGNEPFQARLKLRPSGPKVPCSVHTFQISTARPGAWSVSQPGAGKGQEELRHLSGTLSVGGWGAGEAMATAAEPADGSEGPKPEKGRPEAARSEKSRLVAEVVGEKTSGPEAGARGHRRQKPKSRATESQSTKVQAQSTEEPKLEGREPEDPSAAPFCDRRESSIPALGEARASLERPWHVLVPTHPGLTPDPAGLTCVAHGSGVHCA